LLTSDAGQDLVEYSLLVAHIAFGATATVKTLAGGIRVAFTDTSAALASTTTRFSECRGAWDRSLSDSF